MPCDGDLLTSSPASLCGVELHSLTGLPSDREYFEDVILPQAHTPHTLASKIYQLMQLWAKTWNNPCPPSQQKGGGTHRHVPRLYIMKVMKPVWDITKSPQLNSKSSLLGVKVHRNKKNCFGKEISIETADRTQWQRFFSPLIDSGVTFHNCFRMKQPLIP